MTSVPVLFLVFNRPENTLEVFAKIRQAKPVKLFIAADGPRQDNLSDVEKCIAVRAINTQVDWDCEVYTLFRDSNLGCKLAVSSAIDWFFEHVEEGVILEDDCVPDLTFFGFCECMLAHYRFDSRVMMVSGTNYLPFDESVNCSGSYFFSNYYTIWGWATWRRAWKTYDVDMKCWPELKKKKNIEWLFPSKKIADFYAHMFDQVTDGFNTWDVQWWFACIFQHGLCIVPNRNLISNIGEEGTHSDTQSDYATRMPVAPMSLDSLTHPDHVHADRRLNEKLFHASHAQLLVDQETEKRESHDAKPASSMSHYLRKTLRRVVGEIAGKIRVRQNHRSTE